MPIIPGRCSWTWDEWQNVEVDILPPRRGPLVWGFDPGGSSAFSAIAAYWVGSGRLEAVQHVGGVPDLATRSRADNVGRAYKAMEREGSLIVHPGRRRPSLPAVVRSAVALFGRPRLIVTDFFRMPELKDALDAARLRVEVVPRRTQWSHQTEDIRRAQSVIDEGRVAVERSVAWVNALSESRIQHGQGALHEAGDGLDCGQAEAGEDRPCIRPGVRAGRS